MRESKNRPLSWPLALLVLIAAAFIIFHRLGAGSIWRDEAFSVELAKQSLGQMLHVTLTVEGNMFFYYFLMHGWLGILNLFHLPWSAFWVRVPNAVAFVAASVTLWRLADYLTGRIGGIVTVLIWWAFPWVITYGQQARSFSLFFFFTALSFYALVRLIDAGDDREAKRWAWIYGIATLLDVYSFMDSVFFTITQALWATWAWRSGRIDGKRYQRYWMMVIGAAICSLPLLPSIKHGGQVGWVPLQTFHDIVHYPTTWLEAKRTSLITVFIILGIVLGIITSVLPRKDDKDQARTRQAVVLGLAWAVIPLLLEYAVFKYLHFHILDAVYGLPTALGIALASGAGWMSLRRSTVAWAVLVATVLIAYPQWHRGQGISLEKWNTPVLTWAHFVTPHQSIVCIDNIGGIQYTLQYFIDAHHLPITIKPYPGHFTWNEYVNLKSKGAYFAQAASVAALQKAGILKPGHQVWLATADVPASLVQPLRTWLAQHATLRRTVSGTKWPVSFQLYQVR